MFRRRGVQKTAAKDDAPSPHDLHEWVRSLPWVVERPYAVGTPGVRSFAVDCEPLGRDQLWLITGLPHRAHDGGLGISVIVPRHAWRLTPRGEIGIDGARGRFRGNTTSV
jgi:hypothetical protein